MQKLINKKGVETLVFAETFEYEAYEQIKRLINFEAYENSKVRIMPDAHAGKGCTVGTTMTITDKVTPNLVGVDIGCGMLTIKLKNTEINFAQLDEVIKTKIPKWCFFLLVVNIIFCIFVGVKFYIKWRTKI